MADVHVFPDPLNPLKKQFKTKHPRNGVPMAILNVKIMNA